MENELVVASGYFDPVHVGHLEYLKKSKELGNILIVIVNNNNQKTLKAGSYMIDEQDRLEIVRNIKCVDMAILSIDQDRSVCKTLELLHSLFNVDIFTNGGDVTNDTCREKETCEKLGIKMIDNLGQKIRSSSQYKR